MCATVGSYRRTCFHHRTGRPDRSTSSTSVKPGRQGIGNPQGRTLRTWNDVANDPRAAEGGEPRFMDGRYLAPGHTENVRTGLRDASMAMAWNQATTRPSGGSSMREARRAGRMHREKEGKSRPGVPGRTRPIIESVATLPRGPTDGELGSPESPQGAEFKQGPASASLPCGIGSGADGRAVVSVGPQQQEDPRHFGPHLQ